MRKGPLSNHLMKTQVFPSQKPTASCPVRPSMTMMRVTVAIGTLMRREELAKGETEIGWSSTILRKT